jgi:hypothetical protein
MLFTIWRERNRAYILL